MERSQTAKTVLLLGSMMLFCLALSYFFFMGQSLRLDEAQSLWESSRSPADILTIVSQDVHVPLYHEILHFWRLYFGNSVESARFLSMVFYLLCIPAIYALGKLSYDRTVGIYGALLLAISPFMNWYGNEIRMYTMLTLVTIVNQYFFVKLLRKGKLIYGSDEYKYTWLGYGATAVLGAFVHYFFFLNLFSQAVFYFARRHYFPEKSLRNFMLSAFAVALFIVPWLAFVYWQGQVGFQTPLLPVPTTVNLFSAFSQFLFGFQNDNVNTIFLSLWPITIIFGFLTLRRDTRLSPVSEYLLASVLVSILLAFFVSFIHPVFVSRYLIFTVPAMFLLLASLFGSYTPRIATMTRFGLVAVMLITLGIEIVSPTTPVKEDYRGVSTYLTMHSTQQDAILLAAPFTIYPVQYYYRGSSPIGTLPEWSQYTYGPIPPFSASALPQEIAKETAGYQNAWVVLSYDQGYNADIKKYFDDHYQRLASVNFSPGLSAYEYKLRYDTTAAAPTTASTTALAQ